MRLEGWNESVRGSILRDGRASKSAVADFDTLRLPKSGKPDFGARPPQDEVRCYRLLAILLNASGAQTGEAMAVDRVLPGQEFLDRESIAAAGLFKRKEAATHRRNNFRLAANHPALRSRCRQVGDRERTSIGPDDVLHPRAVGLVHATLTHFKIADARLTRAEFTLCDLRFN